jgi:DNA-binding CsgD family transcriptional regulator
MERSSVRHHPAPRATFLQTGEGRLFLNALAPQGAERFGGYEMPRNDNLFLRKPSAGGMLLLNASLMPLHVNREAVDILTYPENPRSIKSLEDFLIEKIRSVLQLQSLSSQFGFVSEFVSGRRRYSCRVFALSSNLRENSGSEPIYALLIERHVQRRLDTLRVSRNFQLTERERQTMEFLLQGLTSKEIATRMRISPNTVKAFIKMIMMKTGTSTRSAIVGKILALMTRS